MTTPQPGSETPSSGEPPVSEERTAPVPLTAPVAGPSELDGWSVLPLAVRISGRTAVPDIDAWDGTASEAGGEGPAVPLIPTAQGVRRVLGHHRAVAAAAEGPDYLQIAVLIDDSGRTASVEADGRVVPGDAVEELAATMHRITGQQLEPQHPQLRRALIQRIDAPELPLLASGAGVPFRAVSQDGWSTILADDEAAWWALRTGVRGMAVAVSSDGAARSLEVLLDAPGGAPTEQAAGCEAACGLSWGPRWTPVSAADDGTAAARLTREIVDLCGGGTREVHIQSLASAFDLDPVDTTRLRNYAEGEASPLVLESVLQLLGLPTLGAKLVEGQRRPEEVDGLRRHEPSAPGPALLRGLVEPSTRPGPWSDLQAAVRRRPELLLALAGTETLAGVGLAVLARRGGRAGRVMGTLSGLALTDAAGTSALYAALRRRRRESDG